MRLGNDPAVFVFAHSVQTAGILSGGIIKETGVWGVRAVSENTGISKEKRDFGKDGPPWGDKKQ